MSDDILKCKVLAVSECLDSRAARFELLPALGFHKGEFSEFQAIANICKRGEVECEICLGIEPMLPVPAAEVIGLIGKKSLISFKRKAKGFDRGGRVSEVYDLNIDSSFVIASEPVAAMDFETHPAFPDVAEKVHASQNGSRERKAQSDYLKKSHSLRLRGLRAKFNLNQRGAAS